MGGPRLSGHAKEQVPSMDRSVHIRPVRLPDDGAALDRLDGIMTTQHVYAVTAGPDGFALHLESVPPLTRHFAVDDWASPDRLWERGWVAEQAGAVAGVACTRYEGWNRRLVIWHLYVDQAHRRQGVARALMTVAADEGRRAGACTAWLETQNVNVPAIRAYQALGFTLCGLDLTLYCGTAHEGDVALYMARALD